MGSCCFCMVPWSQVRWSRIDVNCHLAVLCAVDYEDAEGELLRRIRRLVGEEIPIFITLDLHGNITEQMVSNSTCMIAVRTYPHVDYYERALQAAEVCKRSV
jgi:microcystin degradation protein MlrC